MLAKGMRHSNYVTEFGEHSNKVHIGTLLYEAGGVYHGEILDMKKEGQGNMVFADGSVEDGEWEADELVEN